MGKSTRTTEHEAKLVDKFERELRRRAQKTIPSMLEYLERVVSGAEKEPVLTKKGDLVMVALPAKVRVMAAKTYKELTMDKFLADKRDAPKKGPDKAVDYRKAVEDVAKQKAEERMERLKAEGKIIPLQKLG